MRTIEEANRLVEENLSLATWAVKRFVGKRRITHDQFEILHSAALHGLVEAAHKWDPERGQFTTCASVWMWRRLMLAWREELGGLIRVPLYVSGEELEQTRHRLECSELRFDPPGRTTRDPAEQAEASEEAELLDGAMRQVLTMRQRRVLRLRSEGLTLEEVGTRLGVCKERVRQIEKSARDRLQIALQLVGITS